MRSLLIKHLPYHLRRIKEYTQRYFYTNIFYPTTKKEFLWDLFIESNRFLIELELDYWVNYGTLLGFHRNNDLIPHDIDIDYGCDESFYKYIWENRNKLGKGYKMYDSSSRHNGPKLYISYKGFDADIYFYTNKDNHLHSYERTHWENYNVPIPEKFVFPTKAFHLKNISTRIPSETDKYLQTIYGNLAPDAKRNPKTGFWE